MDRIYAPWRIEWVERDADPIEGCPFCVLPEREDARDARVVARSERNYVLLNNAPYNPGRDGDPREHREDPTDLDDATLLDHAKLKAATLAAMRRDVDPDGVNTGRTSAPRRPAARSTTSTPTWSRGGTATRTSCR